MVNGYNNYNNTVPLSQVLMVLVLIYFTLIQVTSINVGLLPFDASNPYGV